MTRLAVLADIHGNLPALEAIIEDIQTFHVDQVVVAGDIISVGPFSAEVLDRILSLNWAVIRGNHEFYLLYYGTPYYPPEWAEYTLPPYLSHQLRGRRQNIIAGLPDTLSLVFPDAPPLRVVHGSPRSHWEPMLPETPDSEIEEMMTGIQEETVVFAHIHLQVDRRVGRWRLLNPGSAGVPLDGIRRANYMILDGDENGWSPTFRRVDFDFDALLAEYEKQKFFEKTGWSGYILVEEMKTARTRIIPFNRWRQENCPDELPSVALYEMFMQTGTVWNYTTPAFKVNMDLPDESVG